MSGNCTSSSLPLTYTTVGMVEQCPGPPSGSEWEQFLAEYQENEHPAGMCRGEPSRTSSVTTITSERYITDHWRTWA